MSDKLLGDVPAAVRNLVNAQLELGRELFESLTGISAPQLGGSLPDLSRLRPTGCCDIPPPCWMPQPLGEVVSHVCPCTTACIELVVTNCDRVAHTVKAEVQGPATNTTVTPSALTLGPMQRGTLRVCVEIPQGSDPCQELQYLVWVRGCKEHYLRWTVSVGKVGTSACHEVKVNDCPDLVHHWYDHFYCPRPCPHRDRDDGQTKAPAA